MSSHRVLGNFGASERVRLKGRPRAAQGLDGWGLRGLLGIPFEREDSDDVWGDSGACKPRGLGYIGRMFATFKEGGGIATDTSGNWDPVNKIAEIQIGSTWDAASSNTLQAHYKRFTYYPVGLPNSQLITITS